MLGSAIQISDSSIIINVSDHVGSFLVGIYGAMFHLKWSLTAFFSTT